MQQSHDSSNFFRDLDSFDNFEDFANPAHYVAAPDDWALILTDIRTSTDAIHDGHYRDINMVGAACIAAARDKVVYGIQISRRAVTTCLVHSLAEHAYVHFVDGEDRPR